MKEANLYNSNMVRLGAARTFALHAVWLGLVLSGVLWLILHSFVTVKGEFGPEHSPFEAVSLRIHGAAAFAALGFGGMMWGTHMLKAWSQKRRRWSGGLLLAIFAALVVTGYLLYYAGGDDMRARISLVHWAIGLLIPALYLAHRLMRR